MDYIKQNFDAITNQDSIIKYIKLFGVLMNLGFIKDFSFDMESSYSSGHHPHCCDVDCLACMDMQVPQNLIVRVFSNENEKLWNRVER